MAVRIFSDSTSDFPKDMQEKLGLTILPLTFRFGDEQFLQGVDLSLSDFYQRLRTAKKLPQSTQVAPQAFIDALTPCIEAGDEVVICTISSDLSGTYQSACAAKEFFPGAPIYVVDTRTVTLAMQVLLFEAVKMRDAGKSGQEIYDELLALRSRTRLYAIIDDLKYLVMGGRLPGAGAKVGGLLNLKPGIMVDPASGTVKLLGVVRGLRRGACWIKEKAEKDGIDAAYPVIFGHTDAPDRMQMLMDAYPLDEKTYRVYRHDVGEVVGVHAGPGAMAIAFMAKQPANQ